MLFLDIKSMLLLAINSLLLLYINIQIGVFIHYNNIVSDINSKRSLRYQINFAFRHQYKVAFKIQILHMRNVETVYLLNPKEICRVHPLYIPITIIASILSNYLLMLFAAISHTCFSIMVSTDVVHEAIHLLSTW